MTTNQPDQLRIYIIRHGETEWTVSGQHTGSTDIPLTLKGEESVRRLGDQLRDVNFSHVFTSPMLRARQTCQLVGLAMQAGTDVDLREWNYGDFEGQTARQIILARPDWNLFRDGAPNGEAPLEVSHRADRVIHRLRELQGNIAIFTHGHFGRCLGVRWIGLGVETATCFLLGTVSVSILGYQHNCADEPAIYLWNSTELESKDLRAPVLMSMQQKALERWENEGGEEAKTA